MSDGTVVGPVVGVPLALLVRTLRSLLGGDAVSAKRSVYDQLFEAAWMNYHLSDEPASRLSFGTGSLSPLQWRHLGSSYTAWDGVAPRAGEERVFVGGAVALLLLERAKTHCVRAQAPSADASAAATLKATMGTYAEKLKGMGADGEAAVARTVVDTLAALPEGSPYDTYIAACLLVLAWPDADGRTPPSDGDDVASWSDSD